MTVNSPAASYIPLPRFLLQDKAFQDLSNDSKVLYAMLLDRASISKQNGYLEPDGTIRLYFTLEDAQKKLHRSRQCATRIFRELEYKWPDQPQKARFGQTCDDYTQLPGQYQTHYQGGRAKCGVISGNSRPSSESRMENCFT